MVRWYQLLGVASLIPPHTLTAISLRGESLGPRIVINTGVYNRESWITTAEETGQIIKYGRAFIANVSNIQTHARRSLCMQQLTGSFFGQLDLHLLLRASSPSPRRPRSTCR